MMDQCKTPEAQLKCSHCNTTGNHNTSDFCKEKQQEKVKGDAEKDTAKANKVEGRDGSPTGDMSFTASLFEMLLTLAILWSTYTYNDTQDRHCSLLIHSLLCCHLD